MIHPKIVVPDEDEPAAKPAERGLAERPATERPAAAVERSATERSATERPATERPAAERPAASIVERPANAKSTRPLQAGTYRSINAQTESNEDHGTVPVSASGLPADVRVVLQPEWVAGENGGKSR